MWKLIPRHEIQPNWTCTRHLCSMALAPTCDGGQLRMLQDHSAFTLRHEVMYMNSFVQSFIQFTHCVATIYKQNASYPWHQCCHYHDQMQLWRTCFFSAAVFSAAFSTACNALLMQFADGGCPLEGRTLPAPLEAPWWPPCVFRRPRMLSMVSESAPDTCGGVLEARRSTCGSAPLLLAEPVLTAHTVTSAAAFFCFSAKSWST